MVEMVLFVLSAREKQFFMFEPPSPSYIFLHREGDPWVIGHVESCGHVKVVT
jgi:hypothetical protein